MIEVCDAILYDVACAENDSTDIKCGGPAILGYYFSVSTDETKEDIIKFIKNCIEKYNRPLMGISTRLVKNTPVEHLWTKDKIEKCIKEYDVC